MKILLDTCIKTAQRTHLIIHGIFLTVSAILLFVMSSQSVYAIEKLPSRLLLDYVVELHNLNLGTVKKTLIVENGVYTAKANIRPSLKVKLFDTFTITEEARFYITNSELIPISYSSTKTGRKAHNRRVIFDHKTKQLKFNSGRIEPLIDNTYDLGSIAFALMLENFELIKGKVFLVSDGEKNRKYMALTPSYEKTKTPAGIFDAVKISLKRMNSETRFFHVWFDTKTRIPVKSSREKGNRIFTMSLLHYEM